MVLEMRHQHVKVPLKQVLRNVIASVKKFLLTNENVANTRMGIDTTVTLYFRCLDERDSEYVRPNLQKAPDLRIESK
ncbi:hypothetical protein ABY52_29310 [Klebsiella pneumoniae]|nr:hypothetical protein ABY52_29320 [Klebsiella pneumoniae]KXA83355.1 hypothetical protein ABY52_29310 [Klebsiella pneumoniae]